MLPPRLLVALADADDVPSSTRTKIIEYYFSNYSYDYFEVIDLILNPYSNYKLSCKSAGFLIKGLVTNYGEGGGLQNGRGGGHVKFYPYEKGGGGGKSLSHAQGGAQKVLG